MRPLEHHKLTQARCFLLLIIEWLIIIAQGHGAYLLEESTSATGAFTMKVGNVPPRTRVLIKLTYVAELVIAGDQVAMARKRLLK